MFLVGKMSQNFENHVLIGKTRLNNENHVFSWQNVTKY